MSSGIALFKKLESGVLNAVYWGIARNGNTRKPEMTMNTPNELPEWQGSPPYAFSPHLAQALDSKGSTTDALILGHMHHVIQSDGFSRDGRRWVRLALADLHERYFYWLSLTAVGDALKRLEGRGLLLSTNEYRRMGNDRTKAYALDYAKLHELLESTPKGVKPTRNKRLPPGERVLPPTITFGTSTNQQAVSENAPDEQPEPQQEPVLQLVDAAPSEEQNETPDNPDAQSALPDQAPEVSLEDRLKALGMTWGRVESLVSKALMYGKQGYGIFQHIRVENGLDVPYALQAPILEAYKAARAR
jgi:hypothetical protein